MPHLLLGERVVIRDVVRLADSRTLETGEHHALHCVAHIHEWKCIASRPDNDCFACSEAIGHPSEVHPIPGSEHRAWTNDCSGEAVFRNISLDDSVAVRFAYGIDIKDWLQGDIFANRPV